MEDHVAKTRLLEERQRLEVTAGGLANDLDLDETEQSSAGELSSFDQHPADMASETFEREKDAAILTRLRDQQGEVEAALERLDAGDYGSCEECGGPIGDERLEAFPTARFCIEHQAAQEAS